MNFMRTELCECEFYNSASWTLGSEYVRAGHCEYEFDERWVLWMLILWELVIVNVNFMKAEHCKCGFYESQEFKQMRVELWNVDFMR